ncbi:DUF4192 domain-containing protein [Streptomyces paromomycinus]|uniref:DUF4192 domain-containing protein n=1 Tax=Streptomyces paromomycinus TaxID=92743 RepID=A0A401VZL0_STREY|nr:DUF4192 domain-containing protein [Streptomyces paromomycinus]GCD42514.1 hypothetical protein GKJPGBOP_02178 [Streptomyces paromomycinus]
MNQHSESSSQSGQPEQYKRSGESKRPGQPGQPGQPERPGRPEEPGQPAKSGRLGRSGQSRPSVPTRPPAPSRPASASHPAVTAATAAAADAAEATEDGDTTEEARVVLRGPAELADALPYLLGFFPDDSVVLVGLHGERGRFGSRARLGIPTDRSQWGYASEQLAGSLVSLGEERRSRPEGIIVYLCQEPARGESGWDVKERLRPLAQMLRVACGALDVPVLDALCISDGRFWSYCCPDFRCCPAAGTPLTPPGTSVMAAAAAYAGIQVRGSLRELESRLAAWTGPRAAGQTSALDAEAHALVPRMIHEDAAAPVRAETLARASDLLRRFREDPPTGSRRARDACDDALLTDAEAARLILGLQDRVARDRAAEWMEGPDAEPSLRLWQALSRRCVGGYAEYAVAPLSLAGWVAWATGDQPSARVALGRALALDPEYLFAQLLHRGINQGLDPETLRRCLREEREERDERADGAPVNGVVLASKPDSVPVLVDGPAAVPGASPGMTRPGGTGRGRGAERPAASGGPGRAGRPGDSGRCGGSDRPGGPRGSTRPATRTGTGRGGRRSARPGDRSRP